MLAPGASKPWPDALEALTGERRIDAGALLEYFAPLGGLAPGAEPRPGVWVVRHRVIPVRPFFLENRVDSGGRSSYVARRRSSHDGRGRGSGPRSRPFMKEATKWQLVP
jgi:hypothetical protein